MWNLTLHWNLKFQVSNLFCTLNETNKHIGNKISVSILAGAVLYFKYL